eukprot:gene14547-5615_t
MENLVVFDFDNTLIDGNTDSVIIDMFPDLKTTARTYRSEGKGWGETMHSILDKISGKHGRTREHIDSCIYQLEIPKTVKQMFSRIVNLKKSDLIIVSHSNEYFIDILLNMADINKSTFKNILTYPAVWTDKGSLEVQRFHSHVIDCAYCPNDFCKANKLSKYDTSDCNFPAAEASPASHTCFTSGLALQRVEVISDVDITKKGLKQMSLGP